MGPYSNELFTGMIEIKEEASRPVTTIKFSFPKGLIGVSDIHSQSQINGILTSFGRGVVDDAGNVRIGPIGTSHQGISKNLKDAKRFYFGYSKENKTVYVVSKNSMDTSFLQKPDILKRILSDIFDMYKLSIEGRLKFSESSPLGSLQNMLAMEVFSVVIPKDAKEIYSYISQRSKNSPEVSRVWKKVKDQMSYKDILKALAGFLKNIPKQEATYEDFIKLRSTRLEEI
jgi:hypothetical protein